MFLTVWGCGGYHPPSAAGSLAQTRKILFFSRLSRNIRASQYLLSNTHFVTIHRQHFEMNVYGSPKSPLADLP